MAPQCAVFQRDFPLTCVSSAQVGRICSFVVSAFCHSMPFAIQGWKPATSLARGVSHRQAED